MSSANTTSSLQQILNSLQSGGSKKSSKRSSKRSAAKKSSKKSAPSKKFGCSFSRRSRRCRAVSGSSTVDSSCRRVMKHGQRSCRLSSKARKYARHLSARSKALLGK